MTDESVKTTLLIPEHRSLGARLVAFAGYEMPVQYERGVLKEHLWTRSHAGAFDVSHMGPAFLDLAAGGGDPDERHRRVASLIEPLVSGDIAGLRPGHLRYTLLLNEEGGILDDLMIGRPAESDLQGRLYVVVNAGGKDADFALIAKAAEPEAHLNRADDGALVALQGPEAEDVLNELFPGAGELSFMTYRRWNFDRQPVLIARSGYTGEDGFELLATASCAQVLWRQILHDKRVEPIGLGARDSLRLEAALPLYGHDLDPSVSPIEAGLGFAVSKKRLKAGTLRGSGRIRGEISNGPPRVRVGLKVLQGAPAREGALIADSGGARLGVVTSGGFSPSLSAPIAMGFVPPAWSAPGLQLTVEVRGRAQPAEVVATPFVPHRYHRTV